MAARALETVGLAGVGRRYPWQLSGGMQQRVAIARALACDPALLLMDEPFGSVDAQTREDLEDLILAVRRERDMTILLVTHDIDESVYVGDRVVVLTPGPGRIRADLPVVLPAPRDQISTRELPAFVHLRATVGRLVRSQDGQPASHVARPARSRRAQKEGTGPTGPVTGSTTRHGTLTGWAGSRALSMSAMATGSAAISR